MTERHHSAKSARAARSLRLSGINQGLLVALCAAGSLAGIQACGSDSTDGGGAGTSAGGTVAGAGAHATAGNAGTPASAGTPGAGGAGTAGAGTAGAGTAGAGTAGAGTAGAGTAGTGAGGMAPTDNDDVLERNHHASRDGHFMQPKLTKAAIPMMSADAAFMANFTGDMWASPTYISNGPGGKGAFFAVTTGNDVYALDETSGALLWPKKFNIGPSPAQSGAGCGNINPIGILSTPVIDAVTRTLYVAGAIGGGNIEKHEVHAINIDDGTERAGWPVSMAGLQSGGTTFNVQPQNQRSALSLVNGTLYVAYGGHVGDCGNYHGWVVGINTANPQQKGGWATLGQGSAIWAAGGMASDGTSVFAVTGNKTGGGANDRTGTDSEAVVRIGGLGVFNRSDANLFFPTSWKGMDSADADFGSNNPMYITIPGSTPSNYVIAIAKDGKMYLLNASNLGGMGGSVAVATFTVANGNMAVKTSPTSYKTAKGTHVVFSTDTGAVCPANGGGSSIVSFLITAGSPPTAKAEWCAGLNGPVTAPISTTTDGMGNAVVWFTNGGKLTAVDGDTGTNIYTSANTCSGTRRWTSPIAVKGRIIAAGDGHLCSWSVK